MTPALDLALAASARDWPDRLHRFLLDHGGARVRSRVMGYQQAVADEYDVLLIDDICSFLTPRLVQALRGEGREIVGVFDPGDAPDAKRHLLECGITDVIESNAPPEEFLAIVSGTVSHRAGSPSRPSSHIRSFRIGVVGPTGGVGVTEIAIALTASLSRSVSALLVDLDQQSPSIAQRLDLPLHPNLLTAVDGAHHGGDVRDSLLRHHDLHVIGGLATPDLGEVSPVEVDALLDDAGASGFDVLVADLGATNPERLAFLRFNALIVVGHANPVGLTRLVRLTQALAASTGDRDLVAVANHAASGRREQEVRAELARLVPDVPVALVPEDHGLERAAWDGVVLTRGPFARSMGRIASLVEGVIR